MSNQNLIIVPVELPGAKPHRYDIRIGANLLATLGAFGREVLPVETRRVCIVSNPKVFRYYGETARKSLTDAGFAVSVWLMKDGERHKNWRSLESALEFLSSERLTRSDAVVALGGGVVGDLAGFAAAIYLRGVPFVQVPTTFLAQIDSSVGGKTAVNSGFGKNLIGAFHQPRGVLIDLETLKTLPRRELSAGFYEAVKHGALAGDALFNQTAELLQKFPLKSFRSNFLRQKSDFLSQLQSLIAANVAFKAEIVAGDERENVEREDFRSRKILNFGHTVGHALEKITDFRRFKHGEAVGYGMLAAMEISKRLGKMSKHMLNLFCNVLSLVGDLPDARNIELEKIIRLTAYDKKAVGDSFKWILLERFGRAEIVDDKDVSEKILRQSLNSILHR